MGVDDYPKVTVAYKGVFDFKEIYTLLHDFLVEKGYIAADYIGVGPSDLFETEYLEVGESPRDHLIKWKTKKEGAQSFFLSRFDLTFRGTAVTKTEVMIDGKKEQMHKGELSIEIKASFETDVKKIMDNHWLVKHFQDKFKEMTKTMKKGEQDAFEGDLQDLHNFIKRYFKMKGERFVAEVSPMNRG